MGSAKVFLNVLNSISVILSLAIITGSLWFFVQVYEFTSLRNFSHYVMDYNVYWPQAIPWMFFLVNVYVVIVCSCGFSGAKRNKRTLVKAFVIFHSIAVVLLIAAAIIALIFSNNSHTDDFVKDTVWDVFSQMKNDPNVEIAYGNIEKKLHCCGADGPRDYKSWKNEFPTSCCDVFYHGWLEPYAIDCDFSNKLANERHGCSQVAAQYARIAIIVLSAATLLNALISVFGVVAGWALSNKLKYKPRPTTVRNESESKKVLL